MCVPQVPWTTPTLSINGIWLRLASGYLSQGESPCSCQAAAEPRYRALAGKKGIVECQRRGDIMTVPVRLRFALAAVDVVVAHASAKSYAAQAAR